MLLEFREGEIECLDSFVVALRVVEGRQREVVAQGCFSRELRRRQPHVIPPARRPQIGFLRQFHLSHLTEMTLEVGSRKTTQHNPSQNHSAH